MVCISFRRHRCSNSTMVQYSNSTMVQKFGRQTFAKAQSGRPTWPSATFPFRRKERSCFGSWPRSSSAWAWSSSSRTYCPVAGSRVDQQGAVQPLTSPSDTTMDRGSVGAYLSSSYCFKSYSRLMRPSPRVDLQGSNYSMILTPSRTALQNAGKG